VIIGPKGTITIDSDGITLRGNVTVKGTISVSGGGGGGASSFDGNINEGLDFDKIGDLSPSE